MIEFVDLIKVLSKVQPPPYRGLTSMSAPDFVFDYQFTAFICSMSSTNAFVDSANSSAV